MQRLPTAHTHESYWSSYFLLIHNMVDDWGFVLSTLKTGVHLEDFSWIKIRQLIWFGSKSKIADLKQLDTNLNICSVDVEPTDSVRDLGVILDSTLQIVVNFIFPPPSPVPVLVDARPVVTTTTRFCIQPIMHWLTQRRDCWPVTLHLFGSYWPQQRVSSPVCRRALSSQISCGRYTGYPSLIGFITSSVLWCTPSTTALVHPTW